MTTPPAAPSLLDLLTRPRDFFATLRTLPASNARYIWLVLLTGVLAGVYSTLAQRPVQEAMQALPGLPSGAFAWVIGIIGSMVVSLLMWLLLWGLGSLGAGREGRAGEVYGASFLVPLVVALVLLPITALFPLHVQVPAPDFAGLEGAELSKAIQRYSRDVRADLGQQPLTIVGNVLNYGGMAWQFFLAFVGFGVLTGDRQKALRGTLVPLAVFVLLGGAFWLLGRALGGLG